MKDQILIVVNSFIDESEVHGKRILEAGARNVNGSVRSILEQYHPASYLGIDIEAGEGVDQIRNIYDLVSEFGKDSFDIVVCTETLEHVEDWRLGIQNLKGILKPEGIMIFSSPIPEVKYHGYPFDFWRYTEKDCRSIFQDMNIMNIQLAVNTVILKMQKPLNFKEAKLDHIELFSVKIEKQRTKTKTNKWCGGIGKGGR